MTTIPEKEDSTNPETIAPQIALSSAYYHRHKACTNCNLKNADIDGNHRLQCRDCGFVWNPERRELIGQAKLIEAIQFNAEACSRIVHPDADEETIQRYAAGRLKHLQEMCFWYDDKTEAELYVVRFNMLTRLVKQKNILTHLVKTTANV